MTTTNEGKLTVQGLGAREGRRVGAWVVANAAFVFGVLGACIYCYFRYEAAAFYSRFGVVPEEVGLDYSVFLGAAAESVMWIIIWGALLGVVFGLGVLAQASPDGAPLTTRRSRFLAGFGAGFGIVVLINVAGSAWNGCRPQDTAADVFNGKVTLRGGTVGTVFRADPVWIVPLATECPRIDSLAARRHLVYLGSSRNYAVLFDQDARTVYRISLPAPFLLCSTLPEPDAAQPSKR